MKEMRESTKIELVQKEYRINMGIIQFILFLTCLTTHKKNGEEGKAI